LVETTILPLFATAMQNTRLAQETACISRDSSNWTCATEVKSERGSRTTTIFPPPFDPTVPEPAATATQKVEVGHDTPFRWVSAPSPSRSTARHVEAPPLGFSDAYKSPA
jgi:hypothetical protein